MAKFKIGGLGLELISLRKDLENPLLPFYTEEYFNADIEINTCEEKRNLAIEQPILLDYGIKWYISSDDENKIVIKLNADDGYEYPFILEANQDWKKAWISCPKSDQNFLIGGPFGEIIYRNRILFYQGIVLHAAAIQWQGKGIVFSAPAGTGKTTQAKLWVKHKGASILNGDRPAIRVEDDKAYVYGTPWSGSSSDFSNQKAPIQAFIMIEQGNENTIRRIEGMEAISMVLPRCFLPFYDENMMKLAMSNIERIVKVTSFYHMKCKPDREAVEMVYEWVK